MTKQIDDALGLSYTPVVYEEKEILPVADNDQADNEQAIGDVDAARTGMYDALSMSQQAVQDMLSIAQQSQHPKAYEALNGAIKTMADISMGLAELQIKKQRRVKKNTQPTGDGSVTNNLFVGSTAELQQMIENMRNANTKD